jgi:ATP-binding cassette subfamily B protein
MDERPKKSAGRAGAVFPMYAKELTAHPYFFTLLTLSVVGLELATLAGPWYLRRFFNTLVTSTPSEAVMATLLSILAIIAGFRFLEWLMRRVHIYAINHLDSSIMATLYAKGFDYLIGHSYRFFSNQFSGTLTRRVGKFAQAFEALHDVVMMQFFPTAIFVTGAVIILFFRNHTLGLMLGGWVILFVAVQITFARMRQPLRIKRSEEDSRVTGALADAIGNENTIMLFSGRAYELARFKSIVADWHRATLRSWTSDELVWAVLGFLMGSINIALLYGALVYWREGLVTIGDFVLIQAYLITTFDLLVSINRDFRRFYDGIADATEMLEIIETPHEIRDKAGAQAIRVENGTVEFEQVSFAFNAERPLLTDFNLAIGGGEKVALVGPSGAGKSTITRLMLRFYDVTGGRVSVDGQDVRDVTQESLRNAVAFVPQEPILFHRTLMENIRYGRRDATDEEVVEAAKQAHCYDFIMASPKKFDTFVGERGIKLSGGERQRVAIARAILKNAPILILDEATSSLDSESEMLIQDALAKLMEKKTVVAIAHRLSTVMKMDRIIVVEGGKIAMTGTHAELLSHEGGLYKKLWEIQAGGFIENDIGVI